MASHGLSIALVLMLAGCGDASTDGTVFACDPQHPCPEGEVCSGTTGVCLDHAVLLYEDFEQPLDAVRWSIEQNNGTVEAPSDLAHWGQAGMRTVIGAAGGDARIAHEVTAPLPSTIFVRWFAHQTTFADGAGYFKLDTIDGTTHLSIGNEDGRLTLKAGRDPTYRSSTRASSQVADAWTCIELELTGLPAAGDADLDARIYVDGNEATEMRVTAPTRTFERIRLGTTGFVPATVALDDLVVDTVRVGCAR